MIVTPSRQLGRKGGRKRQMTDSNIESAKKLLANGVPIGSGPLPIADAMGVGFEAIFTSLLFMAICDRSPQSALDARTSPPRPPSATVS